MGLYSLHILPRILNWLMDLEEFQKLRKAFLQDVSGPVAEIGLGSGLNLPFYPQKVVNVYAIEPSLLARKLAKKKIETLPMQVEFRGLIGEDIALPSASVDSVVSTWTFCTIENPQKALKEVKRILRPGGRFYFLEHGRSVDPRVAKWQNRLTPLQKKIAGGCHLNRDIHEMIVKAGFNLEEMKNFYMKGPKVSAYMYQGIATVKI